MLEFSHNSFSGKIAALFVRKNTPYAALGCDCYDADRDVPVFPAYVEPVSSVTVERMGRPERERTPVALASWLVELAMLCEVEA